MKDSRFLYPFVMGTVACICLLIAGCDLFDTGTEEVESTNSTFYALGNLPSYANATFSAANDVSPDGAAVAGYSSSFELGFSRQGFIWTRQSKEMRGLKGAQGYTGSGAEAVADGGSVIVGYVNDIKYAARWEGSRLNIIEPDEHLGAAMGISADGSVIVGGTSTLATAPLAFRWSSGEGVTYLDPLDVDTGVTGLTSSALDISDDGSVIVGWSASVSPWSDDVPVRWDDNVPSRLEMLAGDDEGTATSITGDGSVIVGWSGNQAVRWERGIVTGLGVLAGYSSSEAYDVSADGDIVVGMSKTSDITADIRTAFVWTDNGGMRELKDVLETEYELDLSGWKLMSANGISDDGTVIVGEGCNTNREISLGSENRAGLCITDVGAGEDGAGIREAWAVYLGRPLSTGTGTGGNHTPDVAIASPADGGSFPTGTEIDFSGSAEDDEDGALAGDALVWTSSLDGEIGTGESFSRSDLSAGTHTITLTATDSEGGIGRTAVTIDVEGGSTTAGCEAFDLRLDYTPIEVAAGGSDAVAVFVDRSAGFTGQVELTFYSVNGGPSWSDVMTTWAFQPQFVPGDAAASTFSFTMKEDVSAGDYEFGIAGGSPFLEEADPPCTMPVTFRVVQ